MQKSVRRSVVMLLVIALLFANFTSAATAFASETGSSEEKQLEAPSDEQEGEIVENGTGGKEESADSVEENAVKEDSGTVKEEVPNPGETGDGTDSTDLQGASDEDASEMDEAQPEETVEGADNTEPAPEIKTDGQKEDGIQENSTTEESTKEDGIQEGKSQPDTAGKNADKKAVQKKGALRAGSGQDVEFKDMTLVVTVATGKITSALDVEYQIRLWVETDEGSVPFANQTLPSGETTDENGVVKKQLQIVAGESSAHETIKVPKGYRFEATLSPDETDEVALFFSSVSARPSAGFTGITDYYSKIVCSAYVKPEVHIVKEDANGNPLIDAKLCVLDSSGEKVDSWTSDDSEHTVRLAPNINGIAGSYYTLVEESAPAGFVKADPIQFRVYPEPSGVVINNTQYTDYTIHMVDELLPGSLRVEMDFDNLDDIVDSDTNAYPFYVTVQIDGLKTTKQYTYQYTYGQFDGERSVYLGPDNNSFVQQLHSYDHLVLSGLPAGATYSVSQATAADKRYTDPVYDEFKTGTIESDEEAKTVITNAPHVYSWTLTKQVDGADDGQEFVFYISFTDDFFQWGSAGRVYELNGERHELPVERQWTTSSGRVESILGGYFTIKNGDTFTSTFPTS